MSTAEQWNRSVAHWRNTADRRKRKHEKKDAVFPRSHTDCPGSVTTRLTQKRWLFRIWIVCYFGSVNEKCCVRWQHFNWTTSNVSKQKFSHRNSQSWRFTAQEMRNEGLKQHLFTWWKLFLSIRAPKIQYHHYKSLVCNHITRHFSRILLTKLLSLTLVSMLFTYVQSWFFSDACYSVLTCAEDWRHWGYEATVGSFAVCDLQV